MIDVYYFSGSGHSLEVAAFCAERLGARMISVERGMKCGKGERALLIFPVYCENIPKPVKYFLRESRAKYLALIATFGGISYGRVLYEAQKIFAGRVIAGAYVPTEHAYRRDGFRFDGDALEPFFEKLLCGEEILIPKTPKNIFSDFLPAWRSRRGVKLIRSSACDGCGRCVTQCPTGAMRAAPPPRNGRRSNRAHRANFLRQFFRAGVPLRCRPRAFRPWRARFPPRRRAAARF